MTTVTMTVKLINAPGNTGRGSIVGTDDTRLGFFAEKASLFQIGKTYEVDVTDKEYNGRMIRNVKSAREVAPAALAAAPLPAAAAASHDSYSSKDQEIWVAALYKSAIEAGQVNIFDKQQMWEAGQIFLGLRRHLFGQAALHATNGGAGVKRVA